MRGMRVDELDFCVSGNGAAHGTTPSGLDSVGDVTGGLGTPGYSWKTTPCFEEVGV